MGHDEAFGVGVEDIAYGTASAAIDHWFRPASNTYKAKPRVGPLLGPSGKMVPLRYVSASAYRHFADVPDRSGTVVLEAEYDDMGFILANVFGNPTTTDDADVTSATHVFLLPDATPANMPYSLSTARVTGLEDTQLVGGMINTWTLRGQPGQYVTQSCDFVGSGGGLIEVNDTIGTLSTAPWLEFYHSKIQVSTDLTAGNLADLSTGGDIESWSLTMNNNLLIEEAAGAGTWSIRPPIWNDFRICELEFTHRLVSDEMWNLIHPTLGEDARYKYVRLLLDTGVSAGGAGNWSLQVDFTAGAFLGEPHEYPGGGGAIPETVRIQAGSNSTNNPVEVTLINNTRKALGPGGLYAYGGPLV
jgi:hypothetical protein